MVADVAEHFRFRWQEVAGEELPPPAIPAESGEHELQLVQTIPEKVYRARPRGAFRILETYVRALSSAERLIYLESQFLWSPELVEILVGKLREPPRDVRAERRVEGADLRPRQDRDRRRPLADGRLGEPERALALQRQRGQPRQLRARAGSRDP